MMTSSLSFSFPLLSMIIGQTYDARLETPGWDSDLVEYTTKLWTTVPVINGSKNVENSIMSSAAFPPIKVVNTLRSVHYYESS